MLYIISAHLQKKEKFPKGYVCTLQHYQLNPQQLTLYGYKEVLRFCMNCVCTMYAHVHSYCMPQYQ